MAISPKNQNIKITLPKESVEMMDKVRGELTRSQFIDTAIYTLISALTLTENNNKA